MANFKYFAEVNNETIELANVYHDGKAFVGYGPKALADWKAGGSRAILIKAARKIEYKSQPSRHECDARCINATGRVMKCECSCGGKNHGKGSFNCSNDQD